MKKCGTGSGGVFSGDLTHAKVRLRTTAVKRFKKVENATALIWKILQAVESIFYRLKRAELLPAVYVGVQYVDGMQWRTNTRQKLAA